MLKVFRLFIFSGFLVSAAVFATGSFSSKTKELGVGFQNETTGAELFKNNCARCHGEDAKGGKGPDLTSEKRQAKWKSSDEKLVKKITKGGLFMPSFGKKLKPEEIKAIAAFVRTLKS